MDYSNGDALVKIAVPLWRAVLDSCSNKVEFNKESNTCERPPAQQLLWAHDFSTAQSWIVMHGPCSGCGLIAWHGRALARRVALCYRHVLLI